MPLQKQVVGIDLTRGVDKKRDPRLMIPGELTRLENAVFESSNVIKKRNGFASMGFNVSSLGARYSRLGDELVVETGGSTAALYGYSSSLNTGGQTLRNGFAPLGSTEVSQLVRNNYSQTNFDHAVSAVSGLEIYAWEDSRGGVRYAIIDTRDGSAVIPDAELDASGSLPRCLATSSYFWILVRVAADLYVYRIGLATPTSKTALTPSITNLGNKFDAFVWDSAADRLAVAYRSNASDLRVAILGSAGTIFAGPTTVAVDPTYCIACCKKGSALAVVFQNSSGIQGSVFNSSLVNTGTAIINAGAAAQSSRIICADYTGDIVAAAIEYDDASSALNRSVIDCSFDVNTIVSSVQDFSFTGFGIGCGFGVGHGGSSLSMGLIRHSTIQPTFFLVNASGRVMARALTARSAGHHASTRVPSGLQANYNGEFSVAVGERGKYQANIGTDVTPKGLSRLTLDLNINSLLTKAVQTVELNGNLHLLGSRPAIYDGNSIVEHGFHLYPEAATPSDAGAGLLSAGTYQWVATYEWVDHRGRLHRSAPSVPASLTLIASRQAVVLVRTLRLTEKAVASTLGSEVSIVLWRTEANGTIFYRVNSVDSPTANSTSDAAPSVNISDNLTDAALISNEVLYTTGGVLEHEPMPPCRVGCVHQNRMFVAHSEKQGVICYSGEAQPNEGIWFSETFELSIPPEAGRITALASMDDRLIAFTDSSIWAVSGQGPNVLGEQNGYSDPVLISDEVGCLLSSPYTVLAPQGLMFASQKGIRLLNRGMTVEPIGAPVDSLVSAPVATVHLEDGHQIRFYQASNVLVFDYLWQQWSVFNTSYANHVTVGAQIWKGDPVHLIASGTHFREDPSYTNDAGNSIFMALETGWLKFAGIQALQRIYRVLFLGSFSTSGSTLSLEAGYDYETAYAAAVTINAASVFSTSVPVQFRHHLPKQKCEAIRFRITETSGTGAGMSLANLSLEVGLKGTAFKLPSGKTI